MNPEAESGGLHAKILCEAARLFVAKGYNGISMREIAEALGVTKAALYYHFKDKQDLILAIFNDYLDEMDRLTRESLKDNATIRENLTALVHAIFQQPPERRAIIRLASQEMAQLDPEARAEFGRLYQEKFIGRFESLLHAGIESGELRQVDAHAATWVLLGMMHPFFSGGQARTAETGELVGLIIDTFFDGVAT